MRLEDIHIGDTVRVRQWDDMAAEFGLDRDGDIQCPWYFLRDMTGFCGQIFEVVGFDSLADCRNTRVITSPLTWSVLTPEVFEPVAEPPEQFDFINLSEYLE